MGFFPYAVLIAAATTLPPATSHVPRSAGDWIGLAWGLGMMVCFYNVWWARDWARRTCGILALAGAVLLLVKIITDDIVRSSTMLTVYISIGIPLCLALAWYSSRPKTRDAMRIVREAISRARAVPG
jgi:hypothetical protein